MFVDEINLHQNRPDKPPPGIGVTFVAKSKTMGAAALLDRIKAVWAIIAKWGRSAEDPPIEELGQEVDFDEEDLQPLPDWFKTKFRELYHADTLSWENDLYDREWVWWSSSVVGGVVKIDLELYGFPLEISTMGFLLTACGADDYVYQFDEWVDSSKVG